MTRRFFTFYFVVVLTALSHTAAFAFSNVVKSIESGVARIISDDATGSGFVATELENENLIVITNEHVVQGNRFVTVAFKTPMGMLIYDGEVLDVDDRRDLAAIEITRKKNTRHDISILKIANRVPSKSEAIAKLGYPGLADMGIGTSTNRNEIVDATFSQGIVSRSMNGAWADGDLPLQLLLHTAPINSGDSGGPLFDECGQVVGVNTSKSAAVDGDIPSGAFWASGSMEVLSFLRELDLPVKTYRSSCGSTGAIGFLSSPLVQIFLASIVVIGLGGIVFWQMTGRSSKSSAAESFAALYVFVSEGGDTKKFGVSSADLQRGIEMGRDASCAIRFNAKDVSRVHAKLRHVDGRLIFIDNGSSNKSYVDGKEVPPHQEQHIGLGSEIQFGQTVRLRFKKAS